MSILDYKKKESSDVSAFVDMVYFEDCLYVSYKRGVKIFEKIKKNSEGEEKENLDGFIELRSID